MPQYSGQSKPDGRVASAVAGDVDALELLLLQHHDRLFANVARHLSAALKRTVCPEDIVQETFIRAYRRIGSFEPQGEDAFYRWLCVIAGNVMRDAVSRHFAAKRGGLASGHKSVAGAVERASGREANPGSAAARREAIAAMQVAIAGLPEHYRQVIELRYIQQLDVAQTAKVMGRTDRAVHMLCHRAMKEIAKVMGRASAFFSSRG